MRLSTSAHTDRPWRIHEIAPDFRVEDVWALPTPGGRDDFLALVHAVAAHDLTTQPSPLVRALFAVRWKLGGMLGWDAAPISGSAQNTPSLRDRLPPELRDTPRPAFPTLPFRSLYLTDDEFAAELANRTMHGVLHLGWVPDEDGDGYHGQMAVLVKPHGRLGTAYMAVIKPFRYLIVYPQLTRTLGHEWARRVTAR
jgi:hypothetical protein